MHFHFVVNPVAGRRTATRLCEDVTAVLRSRDMTVSAHMTTEAGCAARHVRGLEPSACDRLVLVGGDGTLREVVSGAGPTLPFPVGMVPMGTANLVGRELRMPLSPTAHKIADALIQAEPWTVDVLKLRRDGVDDFAVANVGVGVDADVVHAIDRLRAIQSGASGGYVQWVRPIYETLRSYRFPRMSIEIDGNRTYAAASCIVQNAHNYGGLFHLAPDAALDSNALDVLLIRSRSRRDLFRLLFGAWRRDVGNYKDVKLVKASRVRLLASPRSKVQADGDAAGFTDLTIELLPGALTLLRAPADAA